MTDKIETWLIRRVIEMVQTGDANGWAAEAKYLWRFQRFNMLKLVDDIAENGITEPIVIAITPNGTWRMWDGHHRVVVAQALCITQIPVRIEKETP